MFKSLFASWPTSLKWAVGIVATIAFLAFGGYQLLFWLVVGGYFAIHVLIQIWPYALATLVGAAGLGAYLGHMHGKGLVPGAVRAFSWALIAGVIVGLAVGVTMATGLH